MVSIASLSSIYHFRHAYSQPKIKSNLTHNHFSRANACNSWAPISYLHGDLSVCSSWRLWYEFWSSMAIKTSYLFGPLRCWSLSSAPFIHHPLSIIFYPSRCFIIQNIHQVSFDCVAHQVSFKCVIHQVSFKQVSSILWTIKSSLIVWAPFAFQLA